MKSKKYIYLILFILISIFAILYLSNPDITLQSTEIELKEEAKISDLISEVKRGTLSNGEELIPTEQTGEETIEIKIRNIFGSEKTKDVTVTIVDTVAPVIETTKDYFFITEFGDPIDLSDYITVTDNSQGTIEWQLSGDYDTNILGVYPIEIIAADASGNQSSKEIKVIVEQEMSISSDYQLNYEAEFFTTSKGFIGYTHDGVTFVEGVIIANKTYTLPDYYGNGLTSAALSAYKEMKQAAYQDGANIWILSGFRDYELQFALYNKWYNLQGQQTADTHSARPGHSEHQTGMAIDFNSIKWESFMKTKEYAWLKDNCYKYGFIHRYLQGKEEETGYAYEPWHYRYVGVELATKLYNNGDWITLEDYFGIDSQYDGDWDGK